MRSPHRRAGARRRAAQHTPSIRRYLPRVQMYLPWARIRIRARLEHGQRWHHGQRWPTIPLLLALLLLALLLGGWSPHTAAGAATSGGRALAAPRQLPNEPRTLARWSDPANGTAMLLNLVDSRVQPAGTAIFTLPNGDEVLMQKVGQLFALARRLSQLSAEAPFDAATTMCSQATLIAGKSPTAAAIAQPVNMVLGVHVGQGGLLAYAGLNFAPAAPVAFAAISCVLTSPKYEMKAGCSDLTSPCTPLLAPAEAASLYNQAVVGAAQSGDWNTVYTLTGQEVTAQYSSAAFSSLMNQQVQQVGRITSLVPASAPSAILFNSASQAYFVSQDTVTLDHNGTTKTQLITSYYLLEGGAWKLWFSCQPGKC